VNGSSALTIDLPDKAATGRLAALLARDARRGDLIALRGALGSGKTTFARAFIRARGHDGEDVPSPTFTLVEIYDGDPPIWHFDLYRLEKPEEALELGLEEALGDGICLVEWPERIAAMLPPDRLDLGLQAGVAPGARIATLGPSPAWRQRLAGLIHA